MLNRTGLDSMLDTMVESGASTLHLVSGRVPCLRLRGKLIRSQSGEVTEPELWTLVDSVVPAEQRARLAGGEELETFYTSKSGVCFRHTLLLDREGPNLVFRRVPDGMPSFEELGLPELINSFANFRSGLVVVSGFLGAGRSTTLAAMVDRVNQVCASHIVTVEQPVEYVHQPERAILHQREVGTHVESFAAGVREALRQSADLIMVGDLPDRATVEAVLDASESGCLVLAGLRATNVVATMERFAALGGPEAGERTLNRLSVALRAVVSQVLLQRAHGDGRIPGLEILINNQAVSKAIRGRNFRDMPRLMERGRGLGMQTLDRALKKLLDQHLITMDEAMYHASDREWVYRRGK